MKKANSNTALISALVSAHMSDVSDECKAYIVRDITTQVSPALRDATLALSGATLKKDGIRLQVKANEIIVGKSVVTLQFFALAAVAKLSAKLEKELGLKMPPVQCPLLPGFKLRA